MTGHNQRNKNPISINERFLCLMMSCTILRCHVSLANDISPKIFLEGTHSLDQDDASFFCTCFFCNDILNVRVLNEAFSKTYESQRVNTLSYFAYFYWCVLFTLILAFLLFFSLPLSLHLFPEFLRPNDMTLQHYLVPSIINIVLSSS